MPMMSSTAPVHPDQVVHDTPLRLRGGCCGVRILHLISLLALPCMIVPIYAADGSMARFFPLFLRFPKNWH
jgi:hypothetical protein